MTKQGIIPIVVFIDEKKPEAPKEELKNQAGKVVEGNEEVPVEPEEEADGGK